MNKRPLARLALLGPLALLALLGLPVQALAQPPQPAATAAAQPDVQQTHLPGDSVQAASPLAGVPTRITFDEAVKRAVARNPSVVVAAANILSAEGLLQQARAAVLPNVAVTGTNVTLDDSRGLGDQVVHAAEHVHRGDRRVDAAVRAGAMGASACRPRRPARRRGRPDEVKRQIAVATAQAYLLRDRRAARGRIAGPRARHRAGVLRLRGTTPQGRRRQPADRAAGAADALGG